MCRHRRVCRQSRRRPQRPRNPSPSRTCAESDRPKTPSSGQLGSRVGKFELGARLETMTKAAPTRHAHQEAMAERSTALPPRCGCTGANRRTCLIWPATELSVSAVPARAWVFLRQRRLRRELSLSNTKAASLRPSRPINLRPEATAISTRSTAVGRSTELAERTWDVRKSFVPAQCRGPHDRPQGHHTRHQEHQNRRRDYLQLRPRLSDQCHHTAWLQMRQVPEETSRCAREGTRQVME